MDGSKNFVPGILLSLIIPFICCTPLFVGISDAQSLSSPLQAGSQSAQPTAPSVSSVHVNASLVLVDVVVTNGAASVGGLPESKFHILEDGVPQQISVFEEHKPEDAPVISQAPQLGPHVYSDFPEFAMTAATNVLLLDALNTPLSDQSYVRQQMVQYIKTIPPGTRIAVFTLASRLRMVNGFTADSSLIAKALANEGRPQSSVLLDGQGNSPTPHMNSSGSLNETKSHQQFQSDLIGYQTDMRVQMTFDALGDLARYLAVIPGRKTLIWFSGSFPLSLDPDATLSSAFSTVRDYADSVRQTDDLLTAARVAVYPVDARGLMSMPSVNAANSFASAGSGPPMPGKGRGVNKGTMQGSVSSADQKFLKQTIAEHATMQQIADDTGGKAFLNTNGLREAVGRAIADGTRYYTLGYTPHSTKSDGTFRKIVVDVDGGFQTSHRRGYYADASPNNAPNSKVASSMMKAAIEYGAPTVSEIPFKVRVIATDDPAAKGIKTSPDPAGLESKNLKGIKVRYLIDYAVDAHRFGFTSTADGVRHDQVEFAVVAYDANGRLLNHADQGIGINLNPTLYQQVVHSGFPMHQEIDVPTGDIFLRAVVHEMDSGLIGAVEIPLIVTK
jgi:VWFA-related protein